jgi:hypothetical protein
MRLFVLVASATLLAGSAYAQVPQPALRERGTSAGVPRQHPGHVVEHIAVPVGPETRAGRTVRWVGTPGARPVITAVMSGDHRGAPAPCLGELGSGNRRGEVVPEAKQRTIGGRRGVGREKPAESAASEPR